MIGSGSAEEMAEAIGVLEEGIALLDDEDSLAFCNAAFARLLGPAGSLLEEGVPWALVENALDWRGVYAAEGLEALRAAREGAGGTVDLALDGGAGWHRATLRPTRQGGIAISLRDVTTNRRRLEAHRDAETLLRKVLETAPVSLLLYDMDAERVLYATPFSRKLFGVIEDRIAETWWDPDERAEYLVDLLAEGRVDRRPITARRVSGAEGDAVPFPARISARLIEHEGARVIVASTADVTADLAHAEEMQRLSARMSDAVEAMGQGFALWDAEDRLVTANRVLRRSSGPLGAYFTEGRSRAEVAEAARAHGMPPECVPAEDGPFDFAWDGRAFQGLRRATSEGGAVMVWSDVTAARAAEAELARSREAAFRHEKLTALGELLAGVAHELNNPLSVVVGQALMLAEDVTDPALTKRVARLGSAAERCAKIVKTFLAMARQKPAALAPADLGAVLSDAVEVSGMGPHAAHVTIARDLPPGLPPVLCDRDQIAQVFANLFLNAAQALAGRAGARVTVRAARGPGGTVDAIIEDNGPGIPEALRARIFEPFFTTKQVGEGTGVGLALSARIVATHGGGLTVSEAEGGGARFTVSLPVAPGAEAAAAKEAEAAAGARVLVVEDEDDVAETLIDVLEGAGLRPERAATGEAALEALAARRFDAVLSDLRMPGMGGRALLARIAAAHPEMLPRTAFVTGDAMSPDAEAIRTGHGAPLIEKPVVPSELRALVARLTETAPGARPGGTP